MKMHSHKTMAIAIALFLMISVAISLITLPAANAHSPPWKITTWAYVTAAPNPVGVGQRILIVGWSSIVLPSSSATNDIRFKDLKLTITKPDKTVETIPLPNSDSTSTAYTSYTPDQVGTYEIVFSYPDLVYTWNSSSAMRTWTNDVFLGATSKPLSLIVQQEQLPDPITSYPMPTEYWTRPIEGQNTDWWTLASNWLGSADFSSPGSPQIVGDFQPDGIAPNSAHVMWTKPINDGGLVGGHNTAIDGNTFYTGSSYNNRMSKPIIMHGRLIYEVPYGNAAGGAGWKAVDLRTGEELWYNNQLGVSGSGVPDICFGYYYAYEMMNQHGVVPEGWLFTNNFARAIQPSTGLLSNLNITNVPSGLEVLGPSGEHIRYQLNVARGWLAQWNSSLVFTTQTSGRINASTPNRYDWNVTIPATIPTGSTIYGAIINDILVGSTITSSLFSSFSARGTVNPYKVWAISLKPGSRGSLLWMKDYSAPAGNVTRSLTCVDPVNRVFIMTDKETLQWLGYSIDDGSLLWTTQRGTASDNEFWSTGGSVAYGRFYYSGYGGILYCFDTKTGELLFTYGNGGPGNSTSSGFYSPWGNYPMFIFAIADGKVYLLTGEHSANTPLYKNALVRCVDAFTGEEIWTILGHAGYRTRVGAAVADGFFVYTNLYDMQIYCFGKGPSATTVSTSPKVTVEGSSVLIEGTVMDIAAGTKQAEQVARFPNGVPAMSEKSMGAWMEYVYMQKPRPADAIGVEVMIDVIDANGNYRNIGTATTDVDGFYYFMWTPDIPGEYKVIARFEGSESYWPSHAETAFGVDEAPPPSPTPQPLTLPPTDLYIMYAAVAIILAIAIVGILILRKK